MSNEAFYIVLGTIAMLIEAIGLLDRSPRPNPRVGARYRIDQPIEVLGRIFSAEPPVPLTVTLPEGTIVRVEREPSPGDIDVCVRLELGESSTVIPSDLHSIQAVGDYDLLIPLVALPRHLRQLPAAKGRLGGTFTEIVR